jgi:hypothetical protein
MRGQLVSLIVVNTGINDFSNWTGCITGISSSTSGSFSRDWTIETNPSLASISGLGPLYGIIAGSLSIQLNVNLLYWGDAFSGVTSVKGTSLAILTNYRLLSINLTSLVSHDSPSPSSTNLQIRHGVMTSLSFPSLVSCSGNLYIVSTSLSQLDEFSFPKLTTVGGDFFFQANTALITMTNAFNSLTTVGSMMYVKDNDKLINIIDSFANVTRVGGLDLTSNDVIESWTNAFPNLMETTTTYLSLVTQQHSLPPSIFSSSSLASVDHGVFVTSVVFNSKATIN